MVTPFIIQLCSQDVPWKTIQLLGISLFQKPPFLSSSGTMTHRPTGPIKGARGVVVETIFGRPGNEMKRAAEDGTKWRFIWKYPFYYRVWNIILHSTVIMPESVLYASYIYNNNDNNNIVICINIYIYSFIYRYDIRASYMWITSMVNMQTTQYPPVVKNAMEVHYNKWVSANWKNELLPKDFAVSNEPWLVESVQWNVRLMNMSMKFIVIRM